MSEARTHFRLGRRGTLIERLVVRYPLLSRVVLARIMRLPRGRLRRALVSAFFRRGYEAWAEGGVEATMHLLDPEFEWDMSNWADWPDEPVYRGHDGFRHFWRDYLTLWEEVEFIVDEIIDAGDQIVVFLRQHARGKASGARVEFSPYAQIATIRDGRLLRLAFYSSRADALAAVGMAHEAMR
jgi:ketosteroid isomerase-like protein